MPTKKKIARLRRRLLFWLFNGKSKSKVHSAKTYREWMRLHENDLAQQLKVASTLIVGWPEEKRPLFSIIFPVYNTDSHLLDRAIETVIDQVYPHWELCISDDASTEAHIGPLLEKWAQKDDRIKVHYRDKNGHISANSNSALDLAVGDYCVLMDHDDELRPHSLFEVAKVIIEKPETLFIYSDEDKIDHEGNRKDPHFKSSWNPDLLYVQNYLNHLTMLKTSRLREIGGWRIGYEGSQDHDLYLRFLRGINKEHIVHIPKILYHWRATEGSTANSHKEKSYSHDAGLRSLKDYFTHVDSSVKVSSSQNSSYYRVHYPLPANPPLVSLIVPMRDMAKMTKACVESILRNTCYPNYEILIVNNNSQEEDTFVFLDEIKKRSRRVRIIDYEKPFNFSAINNYAADRAEGEILGLINNDIKILSEGWLEEMVSHALRSQIGCVGAKLYYPNKTIQHAGVILGLGGVAGHSHKQYAKQASGYFSRLKLTQNVSAVTGALMVVKKTIYKEVGGMDEEHLKVAFNDVDFCLKVMELGYRNLWTPYAEAIHLEFKSRGRDDDREKTERFSRETKYMRKRWGDILDNDPYYSPNLTRYRDDFGYLTKGSMNIRLGR
jgi:glycosyltransferase involved in cell wall biosynthesis